MVKFIILRHGFSVFNRENKFTGQCDVELDGAGYEQARDTADYVLKNYKIDAIYSSDLKRAIETAAPIANALKLPIHKSKDLRELDVGEWGGLTFSEVKERYPKEFAHYRTEVGTARCGGGECYAELSERADKVMRKIAYENDGKTVLVSTHGGVVSCLLCKSFNVPLTEKKNLPRVPNASITVAEYNGDKFVYVLVGYDKHLENRITESNLS